MLKYKLDLAAKAFTVCFLVTLLFGLSSKLFDQPLISPVSAFAPSVSMEIITSKTGQETEGELIPKDNPNPERVIELFFGSKAESAKKVAKCESGLKAFSKSTISSAKGLFQIIDGTWKTYRCDGNPFSAIDNTRCAKKIYDRQKSWNTSGGWEASYSCHKQP